jgi:hypothetical protein
MRPNRRHRRRAAAQARQLSHGTAQASRRTGYVCRLISATGWLPRGVHHTTVEHQRGCAMRDGGQCDCVPAISISEPGGNIVAIDEAGNAKKAVKQ